VLSTIRIVRADMRGARRNSELGWRRGSRFWLHGSGRYVC